tara:strand:+ start:5719 stop:6177 length:459 start_codon:yes stop_codon:yes gene_type:complete
MNLKSKRAFLGIDPGKTGGLALVWENAQLYEAWKIPESERDLWDLFKHVREFTLFAMIEKVHSSPQMGVRSAFSFGRSYGMLRGMLNALELPFDEVSPVKWQNWQKCKTGGNKNISKSRAQQLFPNLKITHAIADSLLIADYCRQIRLGLVR